MGIPGRERLLCLKEHAWPGVLLAGSIECRRGFHYKEANYPVRALDILRLFTVVFMAF